MSTTRGKQTWSVGSPEDLGRTIAGVRRARSMTQQDLAEISGIERTYLAKLESGPSSLAIERSLRALRRMGARIEVSLPEDLEELESGDLRIKPDRAGRWPDPQHREARGLTPWPPSSTTAIC